MSRLTHFFEFTLRPIPPYDFARTVKKPAGWSLFTPFEIYQNGVMWTATHISGNLVGIRSSSLGTVEHPLVEVSVFSDDEPGMQDKMRDLIGRALGTDQDLSEFYEFAAKDDILKHAVEQLYGMHDTWPLTIFPEAVLAILLQMAPLRRSNEMMASFIQSYGELAEFDGREVLAWPTPERVAKVSESDLSQRCKVGYRAKHIIRLAKKLEEGDFPTTEQLAEMEPQDARKALLQLPGIGDYSADIINPHGGFPIDVWSAEVFGKLLFGKTPENNREAVEVVKKEGMKRWGKWSWMAFFYIVQDLPGLSRKLGLNLRIT